MADTLAARHHDAAVDPESAARLAGTGLGLSVIANDGDDFAGWHDAVRRGFLDTTATPAQRDATRDAWRSRRLLGVRDPSGPVPQWPVGTFSSWIGMLSVPGGEVPSCAISSVTVAPTHRRRGIARAMMEGELRVAASLGVPVASLTASEAPLYGRYGFAAAASVAEVDIDIKRTGWAGPTPAGRVDFITREGWRAVVPEVFERVRVARGGEFSMPDGHWDRFAGTRADAEHPERLRAVQVTDPSGVVRGAALYTVTENEADFTKSRVDVQSLITDGDDAYAALWRFFVELDLVQIVHAAELSIDEPLLWMLTDRRAATVTVYDHHYVRILDVPAALQARRYRRSGRILLVITDPLGIAEGRFVMTVDDDGTAVVVPAGARATATITVEAGIAELSALLLGQVSARVLAAAGRIRATDAAAFDDVFRWDPPARLSYWY
ncbi:MAG: GNAT family N-acetyltransferase [Microbacterium sp.]|uniref:GNAT family N-acetyltransferase n=1 Tax=Microbacterium sp. TaxID=51671 RepID=UPI00261AA1E1|nr:GNAT family N-acetyltransferase [Microbacterium sp.]MCX6501016.1 GNAT family N-acetyltransferase [Microbacterium sp.]